jgi:quercetin dioxygenase-like cupin family protein
MHESMRVPPDAQLPRRCLTPRLVVTWQRPAEEAWKHGKKESATQAPCTKSSAAPSTRRGRASASRMLQISKTQKVPWHYHSNVQDTFYVLGGELRVFLQDPKEEVRLRPGETYTVRARRPHLVTNGGNTSATFLVLQGIGEYDFVPLVAAR